MTRNEMIREIRGLRADASSAYLSIVKAMESGELPQSAKGTYYYQTYETYSRPKQSGIKASNSFIKGGLTKLRKKDLERYLMWLKGYLINDTKTVAGIKNRLQEMEDSARAVLETYGISSEGRSREDLSYYFQTVTLLREIANLDSDTAIRITNYLHVVNEGWTMEEIYNKVKNSDFNPNIAEKDPEHWYLVTW